MKPTHWITAAVLFLLIALTIVGLVRTREQKVPLAAEESAAMPAARIAAREAAKRPLVDERPLLMARQMSALASTPDEESLAHRALKVSDHEVDLAFFDALRAAEEVPPPLSPEAKTILERKNKATLALKEDQDRIADLTRKLAAAPDSQKENLQDQIDVAKAQIDLDQDEFDDASEELEQAGGDPQSKIKLLKAEHDAGDRTNVQPASAVNPHEFDYKAHTMLAVFRAWKALRDKKAMIQEARQEALDKAQRLTEHHALLTAQVEKEKENREAARQQAKGFAAGVNVATRDASKAGAQGALDSLKQFSRDQKNLADQGRRIQDEQELAETYDGWIGLVEIRQRAALHNLIESLLWILVVVVVVYVANTVIDRLFGGMKVENKRVETLRAVAKFGAELVGAIAILLIVLGTPHETTTILGLAGAGLTVASKDVIMAFFGWFLLMGRNGIRVGDWVEINGVGGEVIEIGLLKTVMLETGNWADAGHPTGRRVSFVNSFAIEGHYFNFSTSGQWMWDELQLTIPEDQDPYAVVEELRKLVVKDTEANAKKAEQEWQHTTSRYHVQAFSAEPAINVRPSGSGVEVRVRYITRAYERHETRKRLYEEILAMMRKKPEAKPAEVKPVEVSR
jgi:small-conductance mechanosensitive channel